MTETRRNLLVGLFVLAGMVALGALIVLFGRFPTLGMGREMYILHIQFPTAAGIRAGTPVTVGGIAVGNVSDVGFADPSDLTLGAEVTVQLEPRVSLPTGTTAETVEPGMGMGRPPIVLIPGPPDQPTLPSGAEIPGRMSKVVESLIPPQIVETFERTARQIGDASDALGPVLEDLHLILEPRTVAEVDTDGGPPGNLSSATSRLDAALRQINVALNDPEFDRLRTAVRNIETMSERGVELMGTLQEGATEARGTIEEAKALLNDTRGSITRVDRRIDEVSGALMANLDLSARFLTQLNEVTRATADGQGTLGALLAERDLYDALVLTVRRLAAATEEFRLLVAEWREGKIRVGL